MVKVSIIMPVFNGEKFLKKSIDSVFNQTLKDLELICVDDGSTDSSLDILNDLKNEFSFIKIIKQNNQGSGKARNTGLNNALGEYVAFLDADDIFIDENALEEMYNFAIKNDASIVSANLKFVELDYSISDNPHYKANDYTESVEYGKIESKEYGIPYAFYKNIYKREFINMNEIRFPDLLRGQDPIFMAKAMVNASEIYTVPLDLYGYNHAVGGGVNIKINTYEKKRDYIQHFKDTCEVLYNGGLTKIADFYKIHLFRFLTFDNNNHDEELFDIFNDVWGIDNKTFDEGDFNYTRFIIPAKFYFINKFDSEEFFTLVNKEFKQINIYGLISIDKIILDEYFMVINAYSLDNFKRNFIKYYSNNLKFKNDLYEFIVTKFLFNLSLNDTGIIRHNTKLVLLGSNITQFSSLSKNQLKKCYGLLWE